MALFACGINHKTAPLTLRERLVFAPEMLSAPLMDLVRTTSVREAAILSTCNRTEIYGDSDNVAEVINWLQAHHQLSQDELNPCLYSHQNEAAVRHMLRVASGLDSMVLGEPQILGQVKTAFSLAQAAGTLGKQLRRLFHYTFSVSKYIRTQTTIGHHPVSVAFIAADLAKRIFTDIKQLNVLLIGAGQTIELAARYLKAAGIQHFCVANRTLLHAHKLAQQLEGEAILLDAIPNRLASVDMVVTATHSPLPIVGKGMVERAFKMRKHRPLFMVDLSVPRNIEPEVSDLADVYLYTIDDLQMLIQKNLQHRQEAADAAETIVHTKAAHYMQTLKVLEATPMIRDYRHKAENIRDNEVLKAKRWLENGLSAEQTLQRLAHNLTNKLLHVPTTQLRQAAYAQREEILLLVKELFEI